MKSGRKWIYRKFLKAKGRYTLSYAINFTQHEAVDSTTQHAFRTIIDWIEHGDDIRCRFGFAFNMKRGEELVPAWKKKLYTYDYKTQQFTLEREIVHAESEYDPEVLSSWGEI